MAICLLVLASSCISSVPPACRPLAHTGLSAISPLTLAELLTGCLGCTAALLRGCLALRVLICVALLAAACTSATCCGTAKCRILAAFRLILSRRCIIAGSFPNCMPEATGPSGVVFWQKQTHKKERATSRSYVFRPAFVDVACSVLHGSAVGAFSGPAALKQF